MGSQCSSLRVALPAGRSCPPACPPPVRAVLGATVEVQSLGALVPGAHSSAIPGEGEGAGWDLRDIWIREGLLGKKGKLRPTEGG